MVNPRFLTQALLFVFLGGSTAFSQDDQSASTFSVHNFTRQDYEAENQNWSITEDKNGYIYAANNIGLLEFDGIDWSFYPSPNGTVIRSVAVDQNNRIFTSGYRELGFWERDSLGTLNYRSLNKKAESYFNSNEEFWTITALGNKIYFHSFSSLFIYDNLSFRVIRPGEIINSIGELNERILMHISNLGIYTVEDSTIKPLITNPVIRNNPVRFMFMTNKEDFLIGTATDGVYLYKNGELIPFLAEWKPYFVKNEINRGTVTKEGNIIIGTILDGISVFNPEGILLYHINNENGLQNNTILGIHNDKNDNIWLSLDRGIDFISFKSDSSYSVVTADEVGAVYSAALFKDNLFLATNQGVFYRKWEDKTNAFVFLEGTQGQTWNCNVFDDQLFISHNNGTYLVNKNIAEKISIVGGGFSLIPNPKYANSLVQSTYSNIVFFKKNAGRWQYSYQLPDLNNLIRYIEIDHFNNLWASHMHRGIFYLKLNDLQDSILEQRYYGIETFGKDNNIQVFQVENRVVFTTGIMIYTYDDINDTIIPYTQLNRLSGKYSASHRIVSGPDHHYWFISTKGIALFRIENNSFDKIKEYPIELFKDHLIIGYENIIPLNALTGLLCLDIGYAILKADKPDLSHLISDKKMSIKSIEVSEAGGIVEKLNLNERLVKIPYNRNSLLIRYSFPLYSNEQVRFQSFIHGMDTGWSEPVSKPEFSFKRLPPGEYNIRVKASNNWLEPSLTEQLKIIVLPPWYLSRISFVIYLVLIFGAVIIFRRILISRIKSRMQKIREGKERELIRLRNEKLDSELSFKSQELANSTMSLIKKNEFLLEIKEIIKSQKEELGLRYPEKYYQKLIRKIDTNISSIDDWKKFETHFERAHEKFLQKLMSNYPLLSPGDLRLCAYLRMNLSSKEIAPLLKISVRGVENHRYKLRKKLNLKPEENLIDFILGL
jgi:DNA-binding CsgD family transcriptional regulator/ligand-binding sensor domain-containing protein